MFTCVSSFQVNWHACIICHIFRSVSFESEIVINCKIYVNAKYWSIINLWYCSSQITWPQATWFHTFWFIWANGIIDETQWILKDFYNPTLYYFPPTWIVLLVWNGPTWYFFHYIFKTEHFNPNNIIGKVISANYQNYIVVF